MIDIRSREKRSFNFHNIDSINEYTLFLWQNLYIVWIVGDQTASKRQEGAARGGTW